MVLLMFAYIFLFLSNIFDGGLFSSVLYVQYKNGFIVVNFIINYSLWLLMVFFDGLDLIDSC